jgi:hypothetical protein
MTWLVTVRGVSRLGHKRAAAATSRLRIGVGGDLRAGSRRTSGTMRIRNHICRGCLLSWASGIPKPCQDATGRVVVSAAPAWQTLRPPSSGLRTQARLQTESSEPSRPLNKASTGPGWRPTPMQRCRCCGYRCEACGTQHASCGMSNPNG